MPKRVEITRYILARRFSPHKSVTYISKAFQKHSFRFTGLFLGGGVGVEAEMEENL